MKEKKQSRRFTGALIFTAFLALLFMVGVAGRATAQFQSRSVTDKRVLVAPAHETEHETRTPEPDETEVEPTETHHAEGTETPEPEETETHEPRPTGTHTPEPEETEVEPTETHHPEESRTPEPEETEVEPTETHHPEGTETPEPEETETHEPHPTRTGIPSPVPTGQAPTNKQPLPPPASVPGTGSRTFPETGVTVRGVFLQYWDKNGGLAQQGFPVSSVLQETSDLNGKTYPTQYFERAVFELHPENKAPYDVLLSQLGRFQCNTRYPKGAPGQVQNKANGQFFAETGHWVGGTFLKYWQEHGGLAQQGYPLSDEFTEVSPLTGKTYTVQYFERAVFELHPENKAPFDVLLSLLGSFQYDGKYGR